MLSRPGRQTYWLESSHLLRTRSGVVNGDAPVGISNSLVSHLWHALVRSIAGPEVYIRSPVVGEVLAKSARGARGQLRNVGGFHGRVKGVLDGY